MIEYNLTPKEDAQHELGGASFYVLTRELWEASKPRLCVGDRPVPPELLRIAEQEIQIANEDTITEQILGAKRRRVR
jgi:hypothetical protein